MRKFIMTTAVCFWAMSQMMAQNILGKIVDAKGEPLAFANVVLLYRQDSVFVKGDCEWRRWAFYHRLSLQRWNPQGNFRRI